jgi:amino acid transporter
MPAATPAHRRRSVAAGMSIRDFIFGRRLATHEEGEQRIGVLEGIPTLGLDALSSAAYGPEAALTVLIPLGLAGLQYLLPITALIIVLLFIVYLSYRQTVDAYPQGGGSYNVAMANLGRLPALVAAAALMLDYVLVVAIGISAGVGAIVSALPALQAYILPLCFGILLLITIINLRGARESGVAFALPTYAFIACMFIALALGAWKMFTGDSAPASSPVPLPDATAVASAGLLLHAFAMGSTALTGVEAVSNGVTAFKAPAQAHAKRTLLAVTVILAVLLAGVALLSRAYGIGATPPDAPGYESVLSQLIRAVAGRGVFYYISIASILAMLALSANTGFAGFPRLTQVIANDDFLPHAFASQGRRLVFNAGVYVIAIAAGVLLFAFGGITNRLIPLFAISAFAAFTLSQAAMVMHWRKSDDAHRRRKAMLNGLGALITGAVLVVMLVARFTESAWLALVIVPALVIIFAGVNRHYRRAKIDLTRTKPLEITPEAPPLVIVPVKAWDQPAAKSLRFALRLSPEVRAVQVRTHDDLERLEDTWAERVEAPARTAHHPPPQLVVLESPYRRLVDPLRDYIQQVRSEFPDRDLVVVVPNLVERKWYQYLMHNQQGELITTALQMLNDERLVVVYVPWHLRA